MGVEQGVMGVVSPAPRFKPEAVDQRRHRGARGHFFQRGHQARRRLGAAAMVRARRNEGTASGPPSEIERMDLNICRLSPSAAATDWHARRKSR